MKCNACGQDRQPRIELRQHGETNVHVGGATGMRLMYVCGNVECNSVLGPHDKPAAPPSPKLDIARANLAALAAEREAPPVELSSAEMAEAAGNVAALIGQPVSIITGAGFDEYVPPVRVALEPTPQLPPSADEIEQLLERRLAFVEAEIERLHGYVREGDKLRAMLEAIAPASGRRAAGGGLKTA